MDQSLLIASRYDARSEAQVCGTQCAVDARGDLGFLMRRLCAWERS